MHGSLSVYRTRGLNSQVVPTGPMTLGIVIQSVQDNGDVDKTCNSLLLQEHTPGYKLDIILWCMNCSSQYVDLHRDRSGIQVVQSDCSFLNSLNSSLHMVRHCKLILICRSGIVFRPTCTRTFLQKVSEYGDETSLSVVGIRIFPHHPLRFGEEFCEGVHWKMYDHLREDRAVDCLTTDVCCFSINTLTRIAALGVEPMLEAEDIWISFLVGHHLKQPIWKIKCEEVSNIHYKFKPISPNFYAQICKVDWPKNICKPHDCLTKFTEGRTLSTSMTPAQLWEKGFGGVNMPAEPASELDFAAAASYGVGVIRIGALCDASDLSYLLDLESNDTEDDKQHLLSVIPRLKRTIQKAALVGLKVILTMADLPGCPFHSSKGSIFSFWNYSPCRIRAAKFWGMLAESLVGVKNLIMGYDLINEPYTPEDKNVDYFNDTPNAYKEELNHFYKLALEEIRKHDKDTMVIVKTTWFASPRTIDMLTPLPDSNIVYSIHVYVPPQLTFPRKFKSFQDLTISYPGPVPKWKRYIQEQVVIDFQYLYNLLSETVCRWQLKHSIPSNRILVAEFGICREVPGSQQYLTDLVRIFTEFKWSWLLFSFRDEEWDAMDYELGTNIDNMLERTANELLLCVADHFH